MQIGDASGTLQDIFRMISNSQVAYNRDVRTRTHKAPNFMPLSHLFVSVDNVFFAITVPQRRRIRILLGSDRNRFPVFQARRADTWHAGVNPVAWT
jgi:hypothetical protein